MDKLKILDLFSGIGGFSLGLERAGMETIAFCEIEDYPRKVLAKHWPDVPIFNDVRNVDYEQFRGVDIICGGFPCTDASTAQENRTGTTGERTGLYREIIRAICMVRPKYTIMENVAGLLDTGMGNVLGDLAKSGYDTEWDCISASDVGAPHERERLWIVANPSSVGQQRPREYFKSINPEEDAYREASWLVDAVQGNALPYVCRRHDGVSKKLAEAGLKAMGNSVVPQIPELIGRAILSYEINNPMQV